MPVYRACVTTCVGGHRFSGDIKPFRMRAALAAEALIREFSHRLCPIIAPMPVSSRAAWRNLRSRPPHAQESLSLAVIPRPARRLRMGPRDLLFALKRRGRYHSSRGRQMKSVCSFLSFRGRSAAPWTLSPLRARPLARSYKSPAPRRARDTDTYPARYTSWPFCRCARRRLFP